MVKNKRSNNRVFVNRNINAKEVRCINQNNENIGILPLAKAIRMAEEQGLDLIQISMSSDNIPTCKIADYGKHKYELGKRDKERAKKQRESAIKEKEIKFRPTTDINDLRTKAKMASKFINEGCRVRIAVVFKGREMSHKSIAEDRFQEFLDLLETDISIINEPNLDGRALVALLAKKSNKQSVDRQVASK